MGRDWPTAGRTTPVCSTQIRNSKHEIRNKSKIQNSNVQNKGYPSFEFLVLVI
jgi:hypothetical protein